MSNWVEGRLVGRREWTDVLFSLEVEAPAVTFAAGQFARLALPAPPGSKEAMLGRPYSFVNPPQASPHEFYVIVVPGGPLSPRLAALAVGEPIWLLARANGFFTIAEVPPAETLWCLATGTGLGPFLSILRTEEPWRKFARVVLVHAVRHGRELTYRNEIAAIGRDHADRFAQVSVVSREPMRDALPGRIPALIADGTLESRVGLRLAPASAQVMLCGNPAMVDDAQKVLSERGMRRHRRREPGHITVETYW